MKLDALIMDVDGTLAETADVKRAAFNQTFAEFGIDMVWGRNIFKEISMHALPGREIEYFTILKYPEMLKTLEHNGLLYEIPARQQVIYRKLLQAGAATLRPGVARLIKDVVSSNLKFAFCSTGPRHEYETLIYNHFGREVVDALQGSVAAEDLSSHSRLRAYRLALQNVGAKPSETVIIDDSPQGCAAAAGLGASVIATPSIYMVGEKFAGARLTISDLGEPTAPFLLMKGHAGNQGYVNVKFLREWHRDASRVRSRAELIHS